MGSKSELSKSLDYAGKTKTVSSFGPSCLENKCSTWSVDGENFVVDSKCWMSLMAFRDFTGQSLAKWPFLLQMKHRLFLWLEASLK